MFEEGNHLKAVYGSSNVFDFSLGNPDLEPPYEVIKALAEITADPKPGLHRYMSNAGHESVRDRIAQMLSDESGLKLSKDQIVMTVGAAGAINVALKTLLDPQDEVIVLAPFFVEYLSYIKNHGGVPVVAACDPITMLPDFRLIEKMITEKTKAIIINSPNNPTGAIYSEEQLIALNLLLKSNKKTIYVISDEPYREIVFDGASVPETFRYLDNAVMCYSWSKTLALPGERIGYLAASPHLDDLDDFMAGAVMCNRSLGFVNAPSMMQKVIERAISAKVDVKSYERRCHLLYRIITEVGYKCLKPQGGLYLFPKSPIEDDILFASIASRHHLLVVPGTGFGFKGYFRLAFCVDEDMIRRSEPAFKNTMRDCLASS
jgi:aspartate aminotransferase